MGVLRYDQASPLSKPVRLPNGFMRAEGYLTRSGIFVYRDAQGKTIRELRPPEEVMHPDSLASFGLMPVTNDHPSELLTADNAKEYQVGTVSESVVAEGDKVRAALMITDAQAIEALDGVWYFGRRPFSRDRKRVDEREKTQTWNPPQSSSL